MKTTSVSELKNGLSSQLKRVRAGEPLLVTDRRRPIALLQPLDGTTLGESEAELAALGIVAPRRKRLKLNALLKIPRARCEVPLSTAIMADRDDR